MSSSGTTPKKRSSSSVAKGTRSSSAKKKASKRVAAAAAKASQEESSIGLTTLTTSVEADSGNKSDPMDDDATARRVSKDEKEATGVASPPKKRIKLSKINLKHQQQQQQAQQQQKDSAKEKGKDEHPLLRDASLGMNPTTLLTGFYGYRGERIRHVVHEGALRLPAAALDHMLSAVVRQPRHGKSTTIASSKSPTNSSSKSSSKLSAKQRAAAASVMARSKDWDLKLPELDSVLRPSENYALRSIVVTDISSQVANKNNEMDEEQKNETNRTLCCSNRTVAMRPSTATASEARVPAERIRGGGGDDDDVEKDDGEKQSDDSNQKTSSQPEQINPSLQANAQPAPDTTTPKPQPTTHTATNTATANTLPAQPQQQQALGIALESSQVSASASVSAPAPMSGAPSVSAHGSGLTTNLQESERKLQPAEQQTQQPEPTIRPVITSVATSSAPTKRVAEQQTQQPEPTIRPESSSVATASAPTTTTVATYLLSSTTSTPTTVPLPAVPNPLLKLEEEKQSDQVQPISSSQQQLPPTSIPLLQQQSPPQPTSISNNSQTIPLPAQIRAAPPLEPLTSAPQTSAEALRLAMEAATANKVAQELQLSPAASTATNEAIVDASTIPLTLVPTPSSSTSYPLANLQPSNPTSFVVDSPAIHLLAAAAAAAAAATPQPPTQQQQQQLSVTATASQPAPAATATAPVTTKSQPPPSSANITQSAAPVSSLAQQEPRHQQQAHPTASNISIPLAKQPVTSPAVEGVALLRPMQQESKSSVSQISSPTASAASAAPGKQPLPIGGGGAGVPTQAPRIESAPHQPAILPTAADTIAPGAVGKQPSVPDNAKVALSKPSEPSATPSASNVQAPTVATQTQLGTSHVVASSVRPTTENQSPALPSESSASVQSSHQVTSPALPAASPQTSTQPPVTLPQMNKVSSTPIPPSSLISIAPRPAPQPTPVAALIAPVAVPPAAPPLVSSSVKDRPPTSAPTKPPAAAIPSAPQHSLSLKPMQDVAGPSSNAKSTTDAPVPSAAKSPPYSQSLPASATTTTSKSPPTILTRPTPQSVASSKTPSGAASVTVSQSIATKSSTTTNQAPGTGNTAATPPTPAPATTTAPTTATTTAPTTATTTAPTTATTTAPTTATTSAPTTATTSAPTTATTSAPTPEVQVIPLKKRPAPQWEQNVPGPNDEMQIDPSNKTPKPEWYKAGSISDLEKTLLPEWFNQSAPHRTPESYIHARETLIQISEKLGNRYVTLTMVRRSVPGDVGSLARLHNFMTTYSLINEDAQNDSAPTPVSLQDTSATSSGDAKLKIAGLTSVRWSDDMSNKLLNALLDQTSRSQKRSKLNASATSTESSSTLIDWNAVANAVGVGCTAKECERQFLALKILQLRPAPPEESLKRTTERSITPDVAAGTAVLGSEHQQQVQQKEKLAIKQEVLRDLIEKSDPKIVNASVEAALEKAREDGRSQLNEVLMKAQGGAVAGLVVSQAINEARSQEDAVSRILAEIVDLRMKKLENRLALLDDIEGMLEAERVALEIERRDLYTARCRHWFGGT